MKDMLHLSSMKDLQHLPMLKTACTILRWWTVPVM
jgi:hypothetical protein